MKKRFVMAVVVGGALVSGCGGVGEPSAAPELSPGASTSVASARQELLSPALEASLSCVRGYAVAGTCDWSHWSEMWTSCQTYEHQELDDGLFLDEVKAGNCTSANWPALRAQLVASRTPLVRLRVDCDGASQVMQEAELDGCYTVNGADASYVEVPGGKTVTLHAGVGCTGDSATLQSDASLCETSFASGAGADNAVRSFRVQSTAEIPSPSSYQCADDEPTCVKNYNLNLSEINRTHTVRFVQVLVAGRDTPSINSIRDSIKQMYAIFAKASHNQVALQLYKEAGQAVVVSSSDCEKAKQDVLAKTQNVGAFLNVYVMPRGMCPTSNGNDRRIFLNDGLLRSYVHETGHVLGLGHGHRTDENGDREDYGDPSTFMGSMPSDNYNLPQLHWLGWTRKADLVKVNSELESKGFRDVTLRPVDLNLDNGSGLPLGAVWEAPDTETRMFVAIPKSRTNGVNRIVGGNVMVYTTDCKACIGVQVSTVQEGRFAVKSGASHIVKDLLITPGGYVSHSIQENGSSVEVFDSITLRIKRSVPAVLTPAAGSVTTDKTPTYSGKAEAGLPVTVFVDGVKAGTTTATALGTWSFTPVALLKVGAHSVRASVADAAGNTSPRSTANAFTVANQGS
ncbi:Ig-like domain-containing protein [Corallococcus sp. CA053C]|uniref:Ig-like domain-containing protein n=1 Tax=Corallococcus sp. CA053C TaxID=2316732 RepID=UPI0018F39AFF|nr:Ig-like domain-containing protein [Corallococcus sp. CA053C]